MIVLLEVDANVILNTNTLGYIDKLPLDKENKTQSYWYSTDKVRFIKYEKK